MEDKLEKKLKAFLPYIIIIGIVYLLVPIFMPRDNPNALTYIVLIGALPITAVGCCLHYSMKKENDFFLALVAPVFFILTMFLYGIIQNSVIRALIYLVAYFLCGYLGLIVGDILADRNDTKAPVKKTARASEATDDIQNEEKEPAERRSAKTSRPRRVAVDRSEPKHFEAQNPYEDTSLDTSTTSDDIDAILNEIHQRRNGE